MESMTEIFEQFLKVKKAWPKKDISFAYADFANLDRGIIFEFAYHASNDVPYRCIKIDLAPDKNNIGNNAVLFSSAKKIFIEITNEESQCLVSIYCQEQAEIDAKANIVETGIKKWAPLFPTDPDLRYKYSTMILVERKVDEVIHNAMIPAQNRVVYFSIGEARERAATIDIFQNAKGADLSQLAMHKWMDFAQRQDQEGFFPKDAIQNVVKNFIQIKKWLIGIISTLLSGQEIAKQDNVISD
jgi:hypothetical protein